MSLEDFEASVFDIFSFRLRFRLDLKKSVFRISLIQS